MAVGPLEQAFVDVVSDVTSVNRGLDSVHDELTDVERAAARTGEQIEDVFGEAGEGIEQAFQEAARSVTSSLTESGGDAKAAGKEIERAFNEAAQKVEQELEAIGGAEAFADIPDGANRAAEAIENAFREAKTAAKQQLREIGDSSEFGTLGLKAEGVGEAIESAFAEAALGAKESLRDIGAPTDFGTLVVDTQAAGGIVEQSFREAANGAKEDLRDIGGPDTFGPVVLGAEAAAESVERSFRDSSRDSARHLGSIGASGAGLSLLSTGLTAIGIAAGIAGTALVGFGLSSAASLEQTTIGFKSLLGSAEEADAFIRKLQQFAATTPFEFQGLADNARKILAMGEAAGITRDDVVPLLTTIGDLTAVLGQPPESIDRVVQALSQMSSKGKVSTEELLQLAEAVPGFPIFQAMADGLGISTAALQDQLRGGSIPAQEGIAALIKGMQEFPGAAGAMAEQAQTLIGLFSTFKDTISLALTEAFQPLVPTIKTALAEAVPVIQTALGTIAPALSGIAGTVVQTLVDILATIGPELGTALGGLSEGFKSLSEGLSVGLSAAAPALTALAPLFDQLGEVLQPILALLGELIGTIIPPLAALFTTLLVAIEPIIDVLAGAFIQVLTALSPALSAIASGVGTLLTTLSPIITKIAELFADVFVKQAEALAPVIIEVVDILSTGLAPVLESLAPIIEEIATAFAEQRTAIFDALLPVLPELAQAFVDISVAMVQLLVALLPLLVPFIELSTLLIEKIGAPTLLLIAQSIATLAQAFAFLTDFLVTNAKPAFDALIAALITLWQSVFTPFMAFIDAVVLPFLRALATMIVGPVAIAVATAVETFLFMWHNVLEPLFTFISGVVLPILGLIGETFQLVASIVGSIVTPTIDIFKAAIGAVGDQISFVMSTFITPLINLLRDVLAPIVGTVVEAFGSMASGIGGVSDVIDGLLGFIDDAIDAIDDLIDKIDDLPGAGVAGKILGGIPGLARGGIINSDVLAQLHAPEVVIPLNDANRALALAEQSGLLDLITASFNSPTSSASFSGNGSGGAAGVALNIDTLNVTLLNGTETEARTAAGVFTDTVETTLRRRQLVQSARTVG